MKHIPDNNNAKTSAEVARCWIKTWFFDVESSDEHCHSKAEFHTWLESQKGVLTEQGVLAIKVYIIKRLEPHEVMWLNWRQKFVLGFEQRTTSIGEALHFSMKSGADGVRPNMNADVAANTMVDKAQRRLGVNKAKKNAVQATGTKLWSSSPTSDDLTTFAETKLNEEWELSQNCKAFEVAPGVYYVITPGKWKHGHLVCRR